jgi:hypothetical protein
LIEEREKKRGKVEHADTTKHRATLAPPKTQPRSPFHFSNDVAIMGLSAMCVDDDADWDELLSDRYWSKSVVENGASL